MLTTIAIVEDDELMGQLLTAWLTPYRYECLYYPSGEEFLHSNWREKSIDLVLVDWQLPGMSGVELIKHIVTLGKAPAIICVTAFSRAEDLAHALHAGADDFVSKPANKSILLARMRAVLRRRGLNLPPPPQTSGITLKPASLEVITDEGKCCRLSPAQFRALECLMRNPGEVVHRLMLMKAVWPAPDADCESRALDLLISRLRQRLTTLSPNTLVITSHYGLGYSCSIEFCEKQTY